MRRGVQALDANSADLSASPNCEVPDIAAHVDMIHTLANTCDGKLMVCAYGEDTSTGNSLFPKVEHFQVGDREQMAACVQRLTEQTHRNAYIPLAVLDHDVLPGKRGEEKDIVAVLGLVADFDDDDAANYRDRLPLDADQVLETSAGRFQAFYLFKEPVAPDRAKLVARQLKAYCRCDHGTADIDHVWRVNGTLNWPNKKKVSGGRSPIPQLVTDQEAWSGTTTVFEDLERALSGVEIRDDREVITQDESSVLPPAETVRAKIEALCETSVAFGEAWTGIKAYPSDSERDLGLCSIAALHGWTRQELQALIQEARGYDEKSQRADYLQRTVDKALAAAKDRDPVGEAGSIDSWPKPLDPFGRLRPAPFPLDILPPAIADYVEDQADRMGLDIGLLAMNCLAAAFGALSDEITIRPKKYDPHFKESARAWIAAVGQPSIKKSPAQKAAMGPVSTQDVEWAKQFAEALEQYWLDEKVHKKRESAWTSAVAKGSDMGPPPVAPLHPTVHRAIVNDVTTEKLADILSHTPRGTLIVYDELSGFFGSMDAYRPNGASKDRAHYLTLYNGGKHLVDRISRGSICVGNFGASIVGGIQPDVIAQYARSIKDDGLLQRFNLVIAEPATAGHDRPNSMRASMAYEELIKQVYAVHPPTFFSPFVLSDEAGGIWSELGELCRGLQSTETLAKGLRTHLGKWEGQTARYALLLHVLEHIDAVTNMDAQNAPWEVSGETMGRVRRLFMDYLLPHAMLFYHDILGGSDSMEHARWIAGFILSRSLSSIDRRTLRQSYRELRKADEASDAALADIMGILDTYNWVRVDDYDKQRVPRRWVVNPQVHLEYSDLAERERQRREHERSNVQAVIERCSQ